MHLRNYKHGKRIGIGSFGKVKVAEHMLTGHKVAIKIPNREQIQDMGMEDKEKGRLHNDEARRIFELIISGVEYCHKNKVVHRDLKPENLLLDSNSNMKIVDFGLSNIMRDDCLLKTARYIIYDWDQIISRILYVGPEVDVWSCGITLYALLYGTLSFDNDNMSNLYRKIKESIEAS
ncbi:Serine/threonine protein kinase [Parasponia andersonii]|uniref:Serine/threonine protein kinase n=1 Tax=Parasponia andersonii TaxID=3476 RepID=A0A2P5AL61_PARAD|nr:Serine/threonine protein kinase [Parasponia andersonii]